jgi:hypothetical protein
MPSNRALGVAFVEIVGPEFVVGMAITHDVVRDFEDLMAHRDDRLLVAAMPFDAVVPRLEGRPVAACGRQAGLDQGAAQIPVALPRLPAAPLAGTFVLAGTHRAPAAQVFGRGKLAHVTSGFSHDADRTDPIHTGNSVQGGQRRFERDQSPIRSGPEGQDRLSRAHRSRCAGRSLTPPAPSRPLIRARTMSVQSATTPRSPSPPSARPAATSTTSPLKGWL